MKVSEIQAMILEQTGIKTSVKKLSGSMKLYTCFSPMFQNGIYPKFPFEWMQQFKKQFTAMGNESGCFASATGIDILNVHIEQGEAVQYKKERKPKPLEEMKVRQWGSKNSQMRLDKAAARYAKKLEKGNCARYY